MKLKSKQNLNSNPNSESNSIRVMKFLEKMQMSQLNPYEIDKYTAAIAFFLILSLIVCHFQIQEPKDFHKEILPSEKLSYIKDGKLIEIEDGNYPVAMPPKDSTLELNDEKFFPMLLILVPNENNFNLYPLNILDDSILPRQGKTLALHILFGFKSKHAENNLLYEEKINDSAHEDYKRKVFYYLHVENGFGSMRRDYMTFENAGDNLKFYRDVDHVLDELKTIYEIENKKSTDN